MPETFICSRCGDIVAGPVPIFGLEHLALCTRCEARTQVAAARDLRMESELLFIGRATMVLAVLAPPAGIILSRSYHATEMLQALTLGSVAFACGYGLTRMHMASLIVLALNTLAAVGLCVMGIGVSPRYMGYLGTISGLVLSLVVLGFLCWPRVWRVTFPSYRRMRREAEVVPLPIPRSAFGLVLLLCPVSFWVLLVLVCNGL